MKRNVNTSEFAWIEANELTLTDDKTAWIRLLPAGTVTLRDNRGASYAGKKVDLDRILEASLSRLGNTQMVIDYDHQSMRTKETGTTSKAAGWVEDLEVRDDGIWAKVAWTEAAHAALKAREYRYISPTFVVEKKTGRVLFIHNAALVNVPAIDMEPIAAAHQPETGDTMDKIAEALGLKADASEDEVLQAIGSQLSASTAICAALDVDKDADEATITAAIDGLKAGAKVDPKKWVPMEAVTAMQADLKALKEDTAKDKATTAVEAAIEAGKLAPALKDWGLTLASADLKVFETFVEGAPTLTSPQLGDQKREQVEAALDDGDRAIMAQMVISEEDMLKSKKECAEWLL